MSNLSDNENTAQGKSSTASSPSGIHVVSDNPDQWKSELRLEGPDNDRHPIPCLYNAMIILSKCPIWEGRIGYNASSHHEFLLESAPWDGARWDGPRKWSDIDDILTCEYMHRNHKMIIGSELIRQAMRAVASQNIYHPIHDYLSSLAWDGEERIDSWLSTCLGVEYSPLTAAFGSKFLISAVARVYSPGCKVDTCLVLEGPQGALKSTALRILFSDEWFTDQIPDIRSKDASIQLHGKWLIEFSDLSPFEKSTTSMEHLKAYLSRQIDCYRPVHGKGTTDIKRQTVFAGTTNKQTWHSDETGGRRFWPVRIGFINLRYLFEERDQLWAEAAARYLKREAWHIDDPNLIRLARQEQAARYDAEPWQDAVEEYLSSKERVTSDSVLLHIKSKRSEWQAADKKQIARCLSFAGWERYNDHSNPNGKQVWMYRPRPKT